MFDLLFNVGPAIKAIFEIGFEPKEEDFYELTEITCKWYLLLPDVFSERTKFGKSYLERIK